jgi:hypothetical protein
MSHNYQKIAGLLNVNQLKGGVFAFELNSIITTERQFQLNFIRMVIKVVGFWH